ncbi:MAG: C-terminal binding protein [Alicyclobacillus sp.]|nr:C-terminal binding protein [Alicyclobacillus sp.]
MKETAGTRPVVWMLDDEWNDHTEEEKILAQEGFEFVVSTSESFERDFAAYGEAAQALIVQVGFRVPDQRLRAMKNVRILCVPGVGFNHVDVAAATELGMWVSHIPDYCTEEVADHTVAMLMYFHRSLGRMDRDVREGRWEPLSYTFNQRTGDVTVGLIGFGRIGRRVSEKLKGIGFHVAAYDPNVTEPVYSRHGAAGVSLDTLLRTSDFVSLHVPLSPASERLISAEVIARMKRGAFLINTCRGEIVDEAALVSALEAGQLGGAGLDVFSQEPLPAEHPLLSAPNVLLSPHSAYVTKQSIGELKVRTCAEVIRTLRGERPLHAVNAPASA